MGNTTSEQSDSGEESLMNQILGKRSEDGHIRTAEKVIRDIDLGDLNSIDYIFINHMNLPYVDTRHIAPPTDTSESSEMVDFSKYSLTDTEQLSTIRLVSCTPSESSRQHACGEGCDCNRNLMRIFREDRLQGGGKKKTTPVKSETSENLSDSDSDVASPEGELFNKIRNINISDDVSSSVASDDTSISTSDLYKINSRIFRSESDEDSEYEKRFTAVLEEEDNEKQKFPSRHYFDSEEDIIRKMKTNRNTKYA